MPFTNQGAGKHAQAEFLKNPDFKALVAQSDYLKEPSTEAAKQIASNFIIANAYTGALPKYVHASDGSFYEACMNERLPSTKVGYVKIASLLINLTKYLSLSDSPTRYIDPFKKSELEQDTKALTMCLPSSNLRYKGSNSVVNGFRLRLFEELDSPSTKLPQAGTLLDTLYQLACFQSDGIGVDDNKVSGKQGFKLNGSRYIIVSKCPNCDYQPVCRDYPEVAKKLKGFVISKSDKQTICPECGESVYSSDGLRLYETVTDHGGLSGGLSRIMNVSEMLLIAHTIINCLKGDYIGTLSDVCFFIDGPLALFGQPAWISRPMQYLIWWANKKLIKNGLQPILIIGIQKQGVLAEHCQLIARHLPRNAYRFVDDNYRNSYLSPVDENSNFGNETYFGQDLIYHSPKGNVFALGIPYAFGNKSPSEVFKKEKCIPENYQDLDRVFKMVQIFESDLYEGSLVPVIMAHRNASISRVPGGKVLDVATRVAFETSRGA